MKRNLLLIASLLFGITVNAQFTQSNAPTNGDNLTLYVLDSLAPNFANQTGESAVWDYSNTTGYDGFTKTIKAINASSSSYASDFPSSEVAVEIEDFITTFFTNSATERKSQGYAFLNPDIGEVIARFVNQEATIYTYPFDYNSSVSGAFSGEVDLNLSMDGIPPIQDNPFTGNGFTTVDAKGTLKLAENTYNNVYRYKSADSIYMPLDLGFIVFDVTFYRTQFEYYDFSVSNLPIFIHCFLEIGGLETIIEVPPSNIVLSLDDPSGQSGINKELLNSISLYPNPVQQQLTIDIPAELERAQFVINDLQGKQVSTSVVSAGLNRVDVSSFEAGVYFVNIQSKGESIVKRIIVQ